jgi:threonine/homoserine/homoserine lactone efflux protein
MFQSARLLVFFSAAILLAIAPGPGMLYVLARTLAGGRREGLFSSFGTFLGGMVHVVAAAAGVSIILAKSAVAFATVKYLGAAYLCFLGIRMILDARKDSVLPVAQLPARRNPFWQGMMTEVLNPKTRAVLSLLHPAIRRSNQRPCVLAVCSIGNDIGDAQHDCRRRRDDAGGAAWPAHPRIRALPPASKHSDRRFHDWTGNVRGVRRFEVSAAQISRILLYLDHLVIVAINVDGVIQIPE